MVVILHFIIKYTGIAYCQILTITPLMSPQELSDLPNVTLDIRNNDLGFHDTMMDAVSNPRSSFWWQGKWFFRHTECIVSDWISGSLAVGTTDLA